MHHCGVDSMGSGVNLAQTLSCRITCLLFCVFTGRVISGYRIQNGTWLELGRMSPQQPEMFYNMTHPGIAISNGDILAARCTMNSQTRSTITNIG